MLPIIASCELDSAQATFTEVNMHEVQSVSGPCAKLNSRNKKEKPLLR